MHSIAQWLKTLVGVGLNPGSALMSCMSWDMFNLSEMHFPHSKQLTSQGY